MNLAQAPAQYDKTDQDRARRAQMDADGQNVKRGGPYDLQSPNGKWWRPSIDNAGTVTWTAL